MIHQLHFNQVGCFEHRKSKVDFPYKHVYKIWHCTCKCTIITLHVIACTNINSKCKFAMWNFHKSHQNPRKDKSPQIPFCASHSCKNKWHLTPMAIGVLEIVWIVMRHTESQSTSGAWVVLNGAATHKRVWIWIVLSPRHAVFGCEIFKGNTILVMLGKLILWVYYCLWINMWKFSFIILCCSRKNSWKWIQIVCIFLQEI